MGRVTESLDFGGVVAIIIGAMALCAALIVALRPLLVRYALARPNGRSSHKEPTPQGGGIAVIAAMLAVLWLAVLLVPAAKPFAGTYLVLSAAVLMLAIVGVIDDIKVLAVGPRFLLQFLAAAIVIAVLPDDMRIVPQINWWLERAVLLIGTVWVINLVNFMDGIDWITVAEVVPVAGGIVLLGMSGAASLEQTLVALTLLGAILGFAPFNRPVAKLFLGDVGSLPIGLLLAWLMIALAGAGHVAAALLLPLYYLADATITLARRAARGEKVWQAHRSHFYQQATDHGFTVRQIVGLIFAVNVVLAALAIASALRHDLGTSIVMLLLGSALVAALLFAFARGRQR